MANRTVASLISRSLGGPELPWKVRAELDFPSLNAPRPIPVSNLPQLFMEVENPSHLLYRIGGQWYDAVQGSPEEVPLSELQLQFIDTIDPAGFRSQPVFVYLQNGLFDIFQTNNGYLYYQYGETVLPEDLFDSAVEMVTPFIVPGADLPDFDPVFFRRLAALTDLVAPESTLELSPSY